jgi:hypothetical protein
LRTLCLKRIGVVLLAILFHTNLLTDSSVRFNPLLVKYAG